MASALALTSAGFHINYRSTYSLLNSTFTLDLVRDMMNNYTKHALKEFRAAGWTDENGEFNDEMQEAICNHVLMLLDVFNVDLDKDIFL